jgi:ribonuclease HII
VIDTHNILRATFFAMTRAVTEMISRLPEDVSGRDDFEKKVLLLVDGNRFESPLPYLCRKIVAGDSLSLSIACASIVAKVTRDRILTEYDKVFPQYGFCRHKGYPTAEHRQAIKKHGLSPIHRKTFRHE